MNRKRGACNGTEINKKIPVGLNQWDINPLTPTCNVFLSKS